MIPAPRPVANGMVASADGTRIAWHRYGGGERTILFVPTWTACATTEIGLEATPDVVAIQEAELDWTEPARLLGRVATPTLVLHGADDQPVPVGHAESVVASMQNARLEVITGGGHRPDIRSPELVNPLLLEFLLAR